MMNFLILFILISLPAVADPKPYKILIMTDATAKEKAEDFKHYLSKKPPYNKMGENLEISVITLPEDKMNCGNKTPDSPRIISCDDTVLREKQVETGSNLAVAFTSKGSGGAGGNIPIASMDYPIQTMFHEMLHAYGLDDEYSYEGSEFDYYCKNSVNSANMTYFKDVPPYADDSAAREKHNKQIPWYGKISAGHLITNLKDLGSVTTYQPVGKQSAGLYRGGSCDSTAMPGWRPYLNSIMRGYSDDTIYPLYEEVIVKNIESSLGRKLNLPVLLTNCLNLDTYFSELSALKGQTESIILKIEADENLHSHKRK